ncbi:MAG: hypothetical protein COA78_20915 [Blastopirellula sp.]|nr:MAG: hypothetical protein COA78_20915 [Blastopirellula sp.]
MSMSIYYTAHRPQPLSTEERSSIREVEVQFAVEHRIAERERTGTGPNWESFCIYDPHNPSEPTVVFEGATKLPDTSQDDCWEGLQHWCQALTAIRRILSTAEWSVLVDDHDIHWNEEQQEFDPSG